MSFIMYLPEGCNKNQIQILDVKEPIDDLDPFREILKVDMTFAHLPFGADYQYVAIFDDNGLLKNNPISTVDINHAKIHGPVFIIRNSYDEDDEDWHGLTKEDIAFLQSKLQLLGGEKVIDGIPEPKIVFASNNNEEFFAMLNERNAAVSKENEKIWVEQVNDGDKIH